MASTSSSRKERRASRQRQQRHDADPVTAYALAVTAGDIVAGPWVRLAARRHLADLKEGPKRGLAFDLDRVEHVIAFFERYLRFAEGDQAGQPFLLQPWQKFILGSLFGWLGPDGNRRFRTAYIEIGKGNGKSPLAGGIGLYMLVADGEAGAEVYSAATTRDQARIVFDDASNFCHLSPVLRARCLVQSSAIVVYRDKAAVFRPLAADGSKMDGLRVHCGIADEVHEHPTPKVIDKIRAGFKGRKQPLMVEITNSGFDRTTICWKHHELSIRILEGLLSNDSWFAYVAALDEDDDPFADESCWPKANPNLDISVTTKYLQEQVAEAKALPDKENLVRRLNFCIWTEQSVRLIPMALWRPCKGTLGWKDLAEKLAGKRCYGGIDLARINDLSAKILVFPPEPTWEKWKLVPFFWVPEDDIARRTERDHVPYDSWARYGLVRVTPGRTTDFEAIEDDIIGETADGAKLPRPGIRHVYDIVETGYDATFALHMSKRLTNAGMAMVEVPPSWTHVGPPLAELMRWLKDEEVEHGDHPVLSWNASNAVGRPGRAGMTVLDKEKATERVDGIAAAVLAISRAKFGEQVKRRSFWDKE